MENNILGEDVVNCLQKELIGNNKLKFPVITKLSKYLKTQNIRYFEIQRLPRHLFTENVLNILDKFNVSLYKIHKIGNHIKLMKEFHNDENSITYIFLIKNDLPNNILLSANHIFSAY